MDTDKDINELLGKLLEVATGLSRFQRSAAEQREPHDDPATISVDGAPTGAGLNGIALQLLQEGQVRRRYVPEVPDHCWPLILDLYVRRAGDRKVSISDACIAAGAAPTTALRWLSELVAQEVIERAPDPEDRRRSYVSLSPRTVVSVSGYLAHVAGIDALVSPTEELERPSPRRADRELKAVRIVSELEDSSRCTLRAGYIAGQ